MQLISYQHPKFALRPHHVWKYSIDIQSATAENRRGKKDRKKEEELKKKPHDETIRACPIYIRRPEKWRCSEGTVQS